MPRMAQVNRLLKETFADCSIEAAKMAISQSTLNKEQIELILSSKGLTGNILETTTAELANATATNAVAVAEGTATTATVGFGTAIKGLGASLKSLAAAHPVLLAITAAIGAIYAAVKIVDACTTTFDELKDKISNLKQEVSDSESTLKNYKTQLDEINQRIIEINSQDSLSLTDEQELENLKNQKTELENLYEIEKARHDLKQKELEDTANEYFNKTFSSKYKTDSYTQKQMKNGQFVDVSYSKSKQVTKLEEMKAASDQMLKNQKELDLLNARYSNKSDPTDKETKEYEKKKAQLEKARDDAKKTALDIQEEAKNQIEGLDSTSDTYKKVTEASQELSDALARLNNDWDNLSSKGKQEDLSSKISKEAKNLTSDDMKSIDNYLSTLSDDDLTILANATFDENTTLESLKETIKAAQEEANKSSIDLSVKTFDPTSLLEESDDKTKTATLADLQSEADLLSSIQKEMSETGRIGVDSMQKIIKQYPEAKDALSEYMAGLIDEQELFAQLEQVYEDDKNAYVDKIYEQMETTTQFLENISQDYPDFFDFLSNLYQDDLGNYTTVAELKKEIDTALVSALDSLWRGHYQLIQDKATGLYSAIIDDQAMLDGTISEEESDNILNGISDEVERANSALTRLNEIKNSYVNQISDNASWQSLGKDLSSSSDSSSGSDSSSEPSPQDFNWIEPLLSKISKSYDRLKNKVSDTTRTWLNRNNALSDSMETLLSEINAQSDAYDFYMDRFNSYDLSDYYKDQVANGSFNIETIYDEDLKNAISDCQDFYDKAQDAKTAVQELNIELKGLAKSRFDNVASEFEKQISYFKDYSDQLQKEMDIITTKGWFSSTSINESMKKVEQDNLDRLKQERDSLMSALNSAVGSGKIEKYSEDWYDMQSSIDSVTSSILDAEKALIEYDNAIRQIKWDAFDRTRNDVENLISETEFLVELLKDKGITDDNGNTTAEGKAAQALLVQKYQLYLNQAQKYKDEIFKIDEELANNPYDKELLDRKQDLIDKQQEAIKSSISEKDAIKDLVNDGYNDFIDKLGDAIDKYKELMSTMKDAYDYEKSIREKTEALNVLEKQYISYQGDNSEEGKKNIQQLKDQINTAKDDLKDTEYEKLISDTEKILDQLQSDVKSWVDQRLDQLDTTIQDIINNSNENASNISDTINTTANEFGVKLSGYMTDIWNNNSFGVGKTLADFSTKYENVSSAINNTVNTISQNIADMLDAVKKEATAREEELKRQREAESANNSYSSSNGSYDNSSSYSGSSDYSSSSSSSVSENSSGVNWIKKKDYYDKNSLNYNTSIVDRLKLNDFDSSFEARSQYYNQMGGEGQYYATYDQNVWMLDWMKTHGYRKGTKSATKGLHIYGEDDPGSEVLVTKYGVLRQFDSGDTVFNKDQVEELWDLSKGITTPNMYMDNLGAKLPDISNMSNNLSNKVDVQFGDVTLSLPNVQNYEDFMKQMVKDKRFVKAIQEGTLGQVLGRNSLNMLTFR